LHYGARECRGLFRSEVLDKYFRLHLERKANLGYHLWGLLILFLWMKKWGIQVASSGAPKVLIQASAGAAT
jgi:asparagine synthase (glutamine-hydrolysing)